MKRYLPVLLLLALIVMAIGSAGCTSSSSPGKTTTETTLGPTMTTPAVPVFTTPAFGGVAEVGITVIRDDPSVNSSRDATESMRNACPADWQVRCTDGYCAKSASDCPLHAQVVNCSAGIVYCP